MARVHRAGGVQKFTSGPGNIAEEFLDKWVKAGRGDQAAILFGDQTITFEQLMKMANKVANVLKSWVWNPRIG